MRLVPLREFQTLTCLSDSVMMHLLGHGLLPCHMGKNNEILIDILHASAHQAIQMVSETRASLKDAVIESVVEHTAPIIRSMVEESLRIALLEAQEKGILSPLASPKKID